MRGYIDQGALWEDDPAAMLGPIVCPAAIPPQQRKSGA